VLFLLLLSFQWTVLVSRVRFSVFVDMFPILCCVRSPSLRSSETVQAPVFDSFSSVLCMSTAGPHRHSPAPGAPLPVLIFSRLVGPRLPNGWSSFALLECLADPVFPVLVLTAESPMNFLACS
jgi:hypothetical protein